MEEKMEFSDDEMWALYHILSAAPSRPNDALSRSKDKILKEMLIRGLFVIGKGGTIISNKKSTQPIE